MKVNEIGFDETSDVEYIVALTSEEMNWVRAYEYMRNNLPERYIEQVDEFVSYALRYDQVEGDKDDGVDNDDAVKAYLKSMINSVYSADYAKPGIREDMKALGEDYVETVAVMANMKRACLIYSEEFTELVHRMCYMSTIDCVRLFNLMKWFIDMRARDLVMLPKGGDKPAIETMPASYESILETWRGEDDYLERVEHGAYGQVEDDKDDGVGNDDAVKAYLKSMINSVYGADYAKTVHPDEDCVLPGCDRYGGNDTYLRIRKVLGHKGAFDFCMGNVIKLVDRWEKKGDPAQNLEKLRDYSAQALVEWRLWNEKLS